MSAAAILPAMMIAGTVMGSTGEIQKGRQEEKNSKADAKQLEAKAKQEVAEGLQGAKEERRQGRLLQSRATALNAAGGGSGADVSTNKLISGIGGEGEYRALTRMYGARERSNNLNDMAKARLQEGKFAKKAAILGAVSNTLTSVGSMGKSSGGGGAPAGGRVMASFEGKYGGASNAQTNASSMQTGYNAWGTKLTNKGYR